MNALRHAFRRLSEVFGSSHALSTLAVLAGALVVALVFQVIVRSAAPNGTSDALVAPPELVTVKRTTVLTQDAASTSAQTGHAAVVVAPTAAEVARRLQSGLRRAKCYDGPISGTWSRQSRDAMARFVELTNARLPVEQPDQVLLALIDSNPSSSCVTKQLPAPLVPPRVEQTAAIAAPPQPAAVPEIGAGGVAAAAVIAAVPSPRDPPRLAPFPLAPPPVASDAAKPERARPAPRARVVYLNPRRYRYRHVQRRPSRTVLGNFSRSASRSLNSLKRAMSLYSSY